MSKVMDESSFNRNNVFTHLVLDEQELGSSSKRSPKHVNEVFAQTSFINMAKVMDESSCNWNNYSAFLDGALAPAEARMNVFLNGECKSLGPGAAVVLSHKQFTIGCHLIQRGTASDLIRVHWSQQSVWIHTGTGNGNGHCKSYQGELLAWWAL